MRAYIWPVILMGAVLIVLLGGCGGGNKATLKLVELRHDLIDPPVHYTAGSRVPLSLISGGRCPTCILRPAAIATCMRPIQQRGFSSSPIPSRIPIRTDAAMAQL